MEFDALSLSRLQFALTISFHILYPTLTIGLALFLAVVEGLWLKTCKTVYCQLLRLWTRVFALSFGLGVMSGVVDGRARNTGVCLLDPLGELLDAYPCRGGAGRRPRPGSRDPVPFRAARQSLVAMLCFIALVSLWTPFAQPAIAARWFSLPNLLYLAPVPLATLIMAAAALWSLHRSAERAPFWLRTTLFALSYLGLIVSLWPYIVPRALTLSESASPPNGQLFVLIGFVIFIPFVLTYTAANYRVFRGKVRDGEGYS